MPKGGPRPNSGRPAKYGNLPVQRVVRIVPVGWVQELDDWLVNRLKMEKGDVNTVTAHLPQKD